MGRSYSVNGFLVAALQRTGRTLLVEGPSDKDMLHRLHVEKHPGTASQVVIDHAAWLNDAMLSRLGNRQRVQQIQISADALAATKPLITQKLATLIDREWDGISFSSYLPNPGWVPPLQRANRFTTIGHSVENYYFISDCAKDYLKFRFSEHLRPNLLELVDERFPALLVVATVVSIKLRDESGLSRSEHLARADHFEFENGRYYLAPAFGAACASRGIANASTIVDQINAAIDAVWSNLSACGYAQWLPHGHIGEDIIWAGVAHVGSSCGLSHGVATEICSGYRSERAKFVIDWLGRSRQKWATPLNHVVDWHQLVP